MVEVWLLQNVVKLWIVKRLYEFVLFARHLATFLSLSSLRALSLVRSLFSFLLPLSCLLQSARGYVDSLPSSCGRGSLCFARYRWTSAEYFSQSRPTGIRTLWRFGQYKIYLDGHGCDFCHGHSIDSDDRMSAPLRTITTTVDDSLSRSPGLYERCLGVIIVKPTYLRVVDTCGNRMATYAHWHDARERREMERLLGDVSTASMLLIARSLDFFEFFRFPP